MVDVSEIARFMPGERTLRLDETQGGKKSCKKKVVRKPQTVSWICGVRK